MSFTENFGEMYFYLSLKISKNLGKLGKFLEGTVKFLQEKSVEISSY
jgi:hypothetical protein